MGTENGGKWIGIGGVFNSPPDVVSWGANRLDIFGLGTDDQMYHKAWNGNHWLPSPEKWELLGGRFKSAPTALSYAVGNTIHILGVGTDDNLYHKAWDGDRWLPGKLTWESLGGKFVIPRPTQIPSKLIFTRQIQFDHADAEGSLQVILKNDGTATFYGPYACK